MKTSLRIPLLASATLLFCACATLVNDSPQTIPITSTPAGARVVVDGVDRGVTPVKIKLPVHAGHKITVEAAGYPARTISVESSAGVGYVVADILFGVVPLIVDIYTKDLYNLKPGKLHFQFAPVARRPAPSRPAPSVRRVQPPTFRSSPRRQRKPPPNRSTQGSRSAGGHCCINRAYYTCPSAAAVAQCTPPQLPMCMMRCGMMDSKCPQVCLSKYPPDPSACSRTPARDSSCK